MTPATTDDVYHTELQADFAGGVLHALCQGCLTPEAAWWLLRTYTEMQPEDWAPICEQVTK